MKRITMLATSITVAILVAIGGYALLYQSNVDGGDILYQVSSLQALYDGKMAGVCPITDLLKHGDIGVGTFDSLDGEMIVLGGTCYQVTHDGKVHVVPGGNTTPFATVAFFHADETIQTSGFTNYSVFKAETGSDMQNPNSFYIITMHAVFSNLTLRSVSPAQPPYPPLSQIVANQTVFRYQDTAGTMVGVYSPSMIGTLDSSGFHFHFLSDDKAKGGHVLDWQSPSLTVQLDLKESIQLDLVPY